MAKPAAELRESMVAAIEILNNTEGVEVASPFCLSTIEVLENEEIRL